MPSIASCMRRKRMLGLRHMLEMVRDKAGASRRSCMGPGMRTGRGRKTRVGCPFGEAALRVEGDVSGRAFALVGIELGRPSGTMEGLVRVRVFGEVDQGEGGLLYRPFRSW